MADRRRSLDLLVQGLSGGAAAVVLGLLAALLVYLLQRALPVLEISFLTEPSSSAGSAGGIRYQLLGTLLLVSTSFFVQLPLTVGLALTVAVYRRRDRLGRWLELGLYVANGVPSILFGLFAYLLFSQALGWGKSWLAGGITLGLMSVPMASLALAERLYAQPVRFAEASRALGLTRSQTLWQIVLPMGRDGLISGSLLGIARAAGETAPILFAAAVFAGVTVPSGLVDSPVLALPYHLFVLAQDTFDPQARLRLWGAAWVLLGVTIGCSVAALTLRLRHAGAAQVHHD